MSTPIPIEITAHVVAAGIDKNADLVRITVAFTPIVIAKSDATKILKNNDPILDLRIWPTLIDNLIKGKNSSGIIPLQVTPLDYGKSWRDEPWPAAVPVTLTRIDKNADKHTAAITAYWDSLM